MGSYTALFWIPLLLVQKFPDSPWRWASVLIIVPSMIGVVWAIAKYAREADELQAKILFESLATAFGAGSLICFTYGWLEMAGAPHLNWMWVWAVYGACWLLASFWVKRKY